MAVHQQRGLRARHGQRQAVPRAVRQPEREGLDARCAAAGRHIVQPHLVASPARLHLQVPATHTAALHITPTRRRAPGTTPPRPRILFRGTHKQSKQHIYSDGDGTGPAASGPRLALHLNIARPGGGPCTSERIAFGVHRDAKKSGKSLRA